MTRFRASVFPRRVGAKINRVFMLEFRSGRRHPGRQLNDGDVEEDLQLFCISKAHTKNTTFGEMELD